MPSNEVLTIDIDLDKKCSDCKKPGVVNTTGLCLNCISDRKFGKRKGRR